MLVLLLIILFLLAAFLARELLKKFIFLRDFSRSSEHTHKWHYDGMKKPGMYNLVIRSKIKFSGVIAFDLHLPLGYSWVDPFGYVSSDWDGVAVISLYLGKTPADFVFLSSISHELKITSTETDQLLIPQVKYPPHFWQKLGFFG